MATAESETPQSVLLAALPPATDYLTYLTLLEYNLKRSELPLLHDILQDGELTSNIGWDLLHILLGLLPESETCLQDVARLGNPREVVLKIIENLRQIVWGAGAADGDSDEDDGVHQPREGISQDTVGDKTVGVDDTQHQDIHTHNTVSMDLSSPEALSELKFINLLSMLSVVHPRIKTKYPSRFLSSTLQAVLATYSSSPRTSKMTHSIIDFIKTISGKKKPRLPLRKESATATTTGEVAEAPSRTESSIPSAPDPEAHSDAPSIEEQMIQTRLLQSFLTHVLEDYLFGLPIAGGPTPDAPGLAWSSRYLEKIHPERVVPWRTTYTQQYKQKNLLRVRDQLMSEFIILAQDLAIDWGEIHSTITERNDPDASDEEDGEESDEELEPPSSPAAITLPRVGSLLLLAATRGSSLLFGDSTSSRPIRVFPQHATILQRFIGNSSSAEIYGSTRADDPAFVDALLFMELSSFHESAGQIFSPSDQTEPQLSSLVESDGQESFPAYLQRLCFLSAQTPISSLRAAAHELATSVLFSNPSAEARFRFIKDTLEDCPFENVRAEAVGWLRDEIVRSNNNETDNSLSTDNIFTDPRIVDQLDPVLWPDLRQQLAPIISSTSSSALPSSLEVLNTITTLSPAMPTHITSLNLLYLLLCSPSLSHIRPNLLLQRNSGTRDSINTRFIHPLQRIGNLFGRSSLAEGLAQDGKAMGLDIDSLKSDVTFIEIAIERILGSSQNPE